jgi:hypothetical protein
VTIVGAYLISIVFSYLGRLTGLFVSLPICMAFHAVLRPQSLQEKFLENIRLYIERLAGIISGVIMYFSYQIVLKFMNVEFGQNTIIFIVVLTFITSTLYVLLAPQRKSQEATNFWWRIGTVITIYINS